MKEDNDGCFGCFAWLFGMGLWVFVAYVVCHFIAKYW